MYEWAYQVPGTSTGTKVGLPVPSHWYQVPGTRYLLVTSNLVYIGLYIGSSFRRAHSDDDGSLFGTPYDTILV